MSSLFKTWTSGSLILAKVESTQGKETNFGFSSMMHEGRIGAKCRRGQRFIVATGPAKEAAVIATKPLTKEDLIDYFLYGCKPKEEWRIGTEHEMFGFEFETLGPIKYKQVAALLNGIAARFDWNKITEGDNIIGLKKGEQSISLEPGGQLELSGAPLKTLHQTYDEINSHLYQAKTIAEEMGIGFLGLGYQPKWRPEDIPRVPKVRYDIMQNDFHKFGLPGIEALVMTCSVQVNLDFSSEADMVRKLRASLALQPDFMAGKLPAIPGQLPTINDWENRLTTIFPEVRLKRYMEMRGADGGSLGMLCALPAFWVGLLYDEVSLHNVVNMIADWTPEDIQILRNKVPMTGLNTPFRGKLLWHVAEDVLKWAKDGLERRQWNESVFLNPLEKVILTGLTAADKLLEMYHNKWGHNIDCVFRELRY